MRNRELINRKLEQIDSNMVKIDFTLKRQGSAEDIFALASATKDLVESIKSFIEQEPISYRN